MTTQHPLQAECMESLTTGKKVTYPMTYVSRNFHDPDNAPPAGYNARFLFGWVPPDQDDDWRCPDGHRVTPLRAREYVGLWCTRCSAIYPGPVLQPSLLEGWALDDKSRAVLSMVPNVEKLMGYRIDKRVRTNIIEVLAPLTGWYRRHWYPPGTEGVDPMCPACYGDMVDGRCTICALSTQDEALYSQAVTLASSPYPDFLRSMQTNLKVLSYGASTALSATKAERARAHAGKVQTLLFNLHAKVAPTLSAFKDLGSLFWEMRLGPRGTVHRWRTPFGLIYGATDDRLYGRGVVSDRTLFYPEFWYVDALYGDDLHAEASRASTTPMSMEALFENHPILGDFAAFQKDFTPGYPRKLVNWVNPL